MHVIVQLPPDVRRGDFVDRFSQFEAKHKLLIDPKMIPNQGDRYLVMPTPPGK